MNILAFVKSKNDVTYLYEDHTVFEALEIMEKHRFTTIPVLNREGTYVGTLSEGDLLWDIKNNEKFCFDQTKERFVHSVKRYRDYSSVLASETMTTLILKASDENFVPIVDDRNMFLGIITRKTLLNYFFEHNFIVL